MSVAVRVGPDSVVFRRPAGMIVHGGGRRVRQSDQAGWARSSQLLRMVCGAATATLTRTRSRCAHVWCTTRGRTDVRRGG
eukprot:2869723-Prymnesium_polylepis.1